VEGGLTLAEEDGTFRADALGAVGREPGILVFGETLQRRDVVQRCDDVG
jgi:hypothetical protein